jgi:hypothetical protein
VILAVRCRQSRDKRIAHTKLGPTTTTVFDQSFPTGLGKKRSVSGTVFIFDRTFYKMRVIARASISDTKNMEIELLSNVCSET